MNSQGRSDLKRLQAFFSGRVQGVGFRFTIENLSNNHPITGFVRNLPDGRVEVVAEAEQSELDDFLKAIQKSHLGRYIQNCQVQWSEATDEFKEFEVRF